MTDQPSIKPQLDYGHFAPSQFSQAGETVLVSWNSEEGIARLSRAELKGSFYQLAHHFQPQINPLYCGIAASVIVLNALRVPARTAPSQPELEVRRPAVWGGGFIPFPSYSQWTLLNAETERVKPTAVIRLENITEANSHDEDQFDPGLSLDELRQLLELYGLAVELHYADAPPTEGSARFRADVRSTLGTTNRFVIVNFYGKALGTPTGGHISPLGAYDAASDSVLILDVAAHKNPWYWVPVDHLYQSMHLEPSEGMHRGWLLVTEGNASNAAEGIA
ncbi:MAG: phytochelatin synthase family protein [Aggregatilineales bacterium]